MVKRVQDYLGANGVRYEVLPHREAFTAQGVAAAAHVSGKVLTKVVMVKRGDGFVMTLLPAACKVNLDRLQALVGGPSVALAKESEFLHLFPDCEAGAMPGFGNLYGLEVCVDEEVARQTQIIFSAGNHHEVVSLAYSDFARLVKPKVAEFCAHA